MNTKLRTAPSGAVIAEIGAGFRTRMQEGRIAITGDNQAIPTTPATIGAALGQAPSMKIGFSDPSLTSHYRATLVCDVQNTANVAGDVQLDLQVSWDNAATFVTASSSTHTVTPGTARQIRVDCPTVTPPSDAISALFQAVISNGIDSSHMILSSSAAGPTIDLQVEELLSG